MSSLLDLARGDEIRGNLSRHGDAFVGRRLATERLATLLDDERAAVLVGPPGVGKSRLATEFGWRFLETHSPASAWFCDLTASETHSDALAAIGRPLGLQFGAGEDGESAIQRIGEVLSSLGTTLLIVDNAERHPDFVAACIQTWRDAAPRSRFLVTSRRTIDGLPAEELRPLPSTEAMTLLEQRVRRLRPDFLPTEDAREDLRRLAARLDGIPLALEIVAPRLRLLSPGQLLGRLDSATGPLEAALQRSWELLEPSEQQAFAQTAVFRGGFDVPAAEAVVSLSEDAPPVLEVIERLVEHSLARISTTREFPDETRLHYPLAVRDFAADRLTDPEDTRRRHVDYFLQRGEEWDAGIDSGDEVECTRRLVVELPNLRAAWEHASGERRVRLGLVLHMALQRGGSFGRQFEVTEDTLDGAQQIGDASLLGRAFLARARAGRWKNDFDTSLQDLEAALEHARQADDVPTEASALRNLAAAYWGRGEVEKTREHAEEALRVSIESSNPVEVVNSRNGLGFLLAHIGEVDAAQEQLEEALAIARKLERAPGLEALVSSSLAALMTLCGKFDEAEYYGGEALRLYRRLDYVRHVPMELLARAEARCAAGRVDDAREDVDEALRIIERMGFRTVRLRAGHVATLVELLSENIPAALDQVAQTIARIDESGDQRLLLGARLYEVIARSMLEQLPQAEQTWEAVAELTAGKPPGRWRNLKQVAEGFLAFARAGEDPEHLAKAKECAATFAEDAVALSLARLLAEHLPDDEARFRITSDGRAFCERGAEPVDITRRKALRGILGLLVELRQDSPGEPATLDQVLEAGWPGEVMTHDSGKRRVYVSVKRLRDLGLEDLLITAGDGYMLDPSEPVDVVDRL
jgi:predicted ATPase/Tfp pilus assembly protein PilF